MFSVVITGFIRLRILGDSYCLVSEAFSQSKEKLDNKEEPTTTLTGQKKENSRKPSQETLTTRPQQGCPKPPHIHLTLLTVLPRVWSLYYLSLLSLFLFFSLSLFFSSSMFSFSFCLLSFCFSLFLSLLLLFSFSPLLLFSSSPLLLFLFSPSPCIVPLIVQAIRLS